MSEIKIIYKNIDDLTPYAKNPRVNDHAVEAVAASINEFGFKNPIIIDKDNEIVAGHTRIKAAKMLGMEEVPTIIANDLTDEQVRAFRIADNKTAELAEWDYDLLMAELDLLDDIDMEQFGFNDLSDMLEPTAEEDDYEIELPEEPTAKLGQIYQLGRHRLMCGDSTNSETISKLLDKVELKCIFTSPPYNMNAGMYNEYEDNLESKLFIDFNMETISEWTKYLKGFLFWNISYNKNARWEFIEILYRLAKDTGLRFMEMIIWDKSKGIPITSKQMLTRQYEMIYMAGVEEDVSNDMDMYYLGTTSKKAYFNKKTNKGITNYWKINPHGSQLDNHKACFPVKLPAKGIKLTTLKGDMVGDPFGGSGSTLIACEQLDRTCYMMELDPRYVDVIIDRWEKLTGETAVLIS